MPGSATTLAHLLGGILQLVVSVVVLILAVKLAKAGLARSYWPLVIWLTLEATEGILLFIFSKLDLPIYQIGQGLKLAVATVVLWRLCGLVFAHYPAIGSFAARAVRIVIPVCVGLGLLSYLTEPETPLGRNPHLQLVVAVERAVTTAVLGFLVALGFFAGWFPLRMKRNIGRVLIGLMVLYGAVWIRLLLANVEKATTEWANLASAIVSLCVATYWLAMWGTEGEAESAPGPAWDRARLERMTSQLDEMQAQLVRRGYE